MTTYTPSGYPEVGLFQGFGVAMEPMESQDEFLRRWATETLARLKEGLRERSPCASEKELSDAHFRIVMDMGVLGLTFAASGRKFIPRVGWV